MEPDRIASAEARKEHDDRLRAEGAEQRTTAIIGKLRDAANDLSPAGSAALWFAADFIEAAFAPATKSTKDPTP